MKRYFLFFSLLVATITASAAVVEPERALQIAKDFVPKKSVSTQGQHAPAAQMGEIVYTHYMPKSGKPALYVVNIGNAFAIVSADDVAHPILGYNYSKSWPTDGNLPPQVKSFFDDLAQQMEAASEHPQDAEIAEEWLNPRKAPNRAKANDNLPDSVGPLLTTTWDQGQYYNSLCPEDQNGPAGHVLTGCVATAMAQIINYWGQKEPIKTRGKHSYESNYGTLEVDYENTTYDFAHMPDALTSESTPEEVNAVAKLMYHCGVAVNMGYRNGESGAYDEDTRAALINFFCFSPHISSAERQFFSNDEWEKLLRSDIALGRPVYYSGRSESSGHAFICEGFKEGGFFYFNYGWGGYCDGWYLTTAINPNYHFNSSQRAIFQIHPDVNSNVIVCQFTQSASSFIVEEPLEFCHLMGYNIFSEYNPYTNYFYGYGLNPTTTFISSDLNNQIVVDILEYENQYVVMYDGFDNSDWSNWVGALDCNISHDNPIVSSENAITMEYCADTYFAGFKLLISQNSECRMVSNVLYDFNDDSTLVNVSWIENGTSSSWKVQYGPRGFTQEEGTTLISHTNNIEIPFESPDEVVEVKIQPTCDTIENSLINSIIVNNNIYWTDIVKQQPDGFKIEPDGTIAISTAEGLAWLASKKIQYSLQSNNISLEADIDLSGYLWKPIFMWRGNINGNGHIIFNLKTKGTVDSSSANEERAASMIIEFYGDTIRDLGFENAQIYGPGAATIARYVKNGLVALNCYSKNYLIQSSNSISGGLFLYANNAFLQNCFAYGKQLDRQYAGGLVGSGSASMVNCFASSTLNNGVLSASTYGGSYYNCFAEVDSTLLMQNKLLELETFFGKYANVTNVKNVAAFSRIKDTLAYTLPNISNNYQYEGSINLVSALNEYLVEMNSPLLRTWVWDSITGYPQYGEYYKVTCPNISQLSASNIPYEDGFAVKLSWLENGTATEWQIKCLPHNIIDEDSAVYFTAYSNSYLITSLTLGKKYDFYVRPICDNSEMLLWSEPISFLVDKSYWVDIVTTRPAGYSEDVNGNITISSPEGLVWLSVCSNGLHRQQEQDFCGKTVQIINDIDLGKYKWTPISFHQDGMGTVERVFRGTFLGNNHTIANLYCMEDFTKTEGYRALGLIGCAFQAAIQDVNLENCLIKNGVIWTGALCGYTVDSKITNCHSINGRIYGLLSTGGLIGDVEYHDSYDINGEYKSKLINNSSSGIVQGDQKVGGIIGFGYCTMINNFSTSDILLVGQTYYSIGTIGGIAGGLHGTMVNNYFAGSVQKTDVYLNEIGLVAGVVKGNIKNNYSINQGDLSIIGHSPYDIVLDTTLFDFSGTLSQEVTISGTPYTDLLSALNAWVDANNLEGIYRHWEADTENINGGFPIFDPNDNPISTGINEIGQQPTANSQKLLRNGQLLILRGDKIYTLTGQEVR